MDPDKQAELDRYELRALSRIGSADLLLRDSAAMPAYLFPPYAAFQFALSQEGGKSRRILEIGSGTGEQTGILLGLNSDAQVYASDISHASLSVLRERFEGKLHFQVLAADMERLPFAAESFDLVASAGSLSYGDNELVLEEIWRVLKLGGTFVCVDSLNHNPIYRLNRWLHFLRGNRTESTLKRLPTLKLLSRYRSRFRSSEVHFFGAVSWLMPVIVRMFGDTIAARLSNWIDRIVSVRRSAFKFVLIARKVDDGFGR